MSDYERERLSKKYKSTTTYVEIWKKFNTFIDSKKLVDLTSTRAMKTNEYRI
jgi:hypothetical protein